jgi:hypothetical protein
MKKKKIDKDELFREKVYSMVKPFSINELLEPLNLKKSEKRDCLFIINMSHDFLVFGDKCYPKRWILKDYNFRIKLTEYEIKHKIFVVGHRLIPFVYEITDTEKPRFIIELDNGKTIKLKTKKIHIPVADAMQFFSLLNVMDFPNDKLFFELYDTKNTGKEKIKIEVFDLTEVFNNFDIEFGDTFIAHLPDYKKPEYILKYSSKKDIEENIFMIKKFDTEFISAMKKVFKEKIKNITVSKQMLCAYYFLDKYNSSVPGNNIGTIIAPNNWHFLRLINGNPALVVDEKHYEKLCDEYQDYMYNVDIDAFGEEEEDNEINIDTIQGIFALTENSYNEDFVDAYIIKKITEDGQCDAKELSYFLYKNRVLPEKLLLEILQLLLEERIAKIQERINKKPIKLNVMHILSKAVDIAIKWNDVIRKFDLLHNNSKEISNKFIKKVLPLVTSLDQIFNYLKETDYDPYIPTDLQEMIIFVNNELPKTIESIEKEYFDKS